MIEYFSRKLRIELLLLRNIRLHGRDAEGFLRQPILCDVHAECEDPYNCGHRQRKIVMRAHCLGARFKNQSADRGQRDDVSKHHHEG